MPTYDYVCKGCKHEFEHFQTMSSAVLRTCPECKKRQLRRLIGSGAGVIFKGSGFYETDYKRKSRGGGKPSDRDEGPSGGDSKPDVAKKPDDGGAPKGETTNSDTQPSGGEQNRGPENRGPENRGPEKSGPEKSGPEKSGPENSGPEKSGHGKRRERNSGNDSKNKNQKKGD